MKFPAILFGRTRGSRAGFSVPVDVISVAAHKKGERYDRRELTVLLSDGSPFVCEVRDLTDGDYHPLDLDVVRSVLL